MEDDDGATITRIHPEVDVPDDAGAEVVHDLDNRQAGPSRWESMLPELFEDPNLDPAEVRCELRFCEIILHGTPRLDAAMEVGWSLRHLRRKLHDPGFLELLEAVEEHQNQVIEQALYNKARWGNMDAIKMWLFNRYPDRWRDVRRIEVDQRQEVSITVAASVRAGVLDLIRGGHTKDLQPGGVLDVKEIGTGD